MPVTISINTAPVLTLWAAVVAQQLGFRRHEALSLGRALAGLDAQAKGRRLGIFKPHEEKTKTARSRERGVQFWIERCGRPVLGKNTMDGIRAVSGRAVVTAEGADWLCRRHKSEFPRTPRMAIVGEENDARPERTMHSAKSTIIVE